MIEKDTMDKRRFVRIALAAAFAFALFAGSGPATAASKECGTVGTWHGQGDSGFTWMDTVTFTGTSKLGQKRESVARQPRLEPRTRIIHPSAVGW